MLRIPVIMKTPQILKRKFFSTDIEQNHLSGFFNATKLLDFYNKGNDKGKRIYDYFVNSATKEYLDELSTQLNIESGSAIFLPENLYETKRGKNGGTWMHPYLFIDFAMWLSPKFKYHVIKWVHDNLIEFRDKAGDHYRDMCDAISLTYSEYFNEKPKPLIFVKEANHLNMLCGIRSNSRNELNEEKLLLLNELQKLNIQMILDKTPKSERWKKLSQYIEMRKAAIS